MLDCNSKVKLVHQRLELMEYFSKNGYTIANFMHTSWLNVLSPKRHIYVITYCFFTQMTFTFMFYSPLRLVSNVPLMKEWFSPWILSCGTLVYMHVVETSNILIDLNLLCFWDCKISSKSFQLCTHVHIKVPQYRSALGQEKVSSTRLSVFAWSCILSCFDFKLAMVYYKILFSMCSWSLTEVQS